MKFRKSEVATTKKELTTKKEEIKGKYKKLIKKKTLFIVCSLILIFIIAGISATIGSYPITLLEVYSIMGNGILKVSQSMDFIMSNGIREFFNEYFTIEENIVWNLRLPRIVMGILAGIGLAIAGTIMQGILRNPLASPYTLGISSAAGFGASLAIILGAGILSKNYLIITNAFVFALLSSFIIYSISKYKGTSSATMILAGIALMYLFSAMTSVLQYFGEAEAVKETVFWMFGGLGRSSWTDISFVFIVIIMCAPFILMRSWDLNIMGLGDETAKSLGVNVERTRVVCFMLASFVTASIVCFTGTIGFIGLVSPHICRMAIGGDNRFLIPASGLFGATLLLGADAVARIVIAPTILPVGMATSFLGVPLFIYFILKSRRLTI
jgi:ABC-type Fe3+-siderophore transport system, permease component